MIKSRRLRPLLPSGLARLDLDKANERIVPREAKALWARAAMDQFGLCGVVCTSDGIVRGHALVCPTLHIPSGHPLTVWSRTPESAALLEVWTSPEAMEGTDRHLVQALAARLAGTVSGIDAAATSMGADAHRFDMGWLSGLGFVPTFELRVTAGERMRLELDRTVSWRPDLRSAWHLLAGWAERPLGKAEPGEAREAGPRA